MTPPPPPPRQSPQPALSGAEQGHTSDGNSARWEAALQVGGEVAQRHFPEGRRWVGVGSAAWLTPRAGQRG